MSTCPEDIQCGEHELRRENDSNCLNCQILKEKVEKCQSHKHTFTCAKKRITMTIDHDLRNSNYFLLMNK